MNLSDRSTTVKNQSPQALAESLHNLPREKKLDLILSFPPVVAGEVLWRTDRASRADILFRIDNRKLAPIITEMPVDWAAHCLRLLPKARIKRVLSSLSPEKAESLKKQLAYKPDTAGARMNPDVTTFPADLTVAQAIRKIRETMSLRRVFHCYAVDEEGKLLGVVPLRRLLMAEPETRLKNLMLPHTISVPVDMDQEEVARVATKNMIFALPVVDKKGRLMGVITLDKVLRMIHEEATEDIYKMAGTNKKEITSQSLFRIARIRAPWLFASFLGGLGAAMIIGIFEHAIAKVAALAMFLPIVLGMGGNIGVQSSTVVVRGLAMGYIDVRAIGRTVIKEMVIGLLLGIAYGIILGFFAMFRFLGSEPPLGGLGFGLSLGLTVGIAIFCSMFIAGTTGAFIPMVLKKINIDPAIATGPFVTTSIDILGIVTYFIVATIFLAEHLV
ncbi:MAG: magnesium transporter [Candidatus Euphemobacter frigidus]|nr:magnesium transporter [Candidatus Euphemobacter frigidus]MDP8275410.1 magnesium transporter [Candidatus Euphemobacter frigidus]